MNYLYVPDSPNRKTFLKPACLVPLVPVVRKFFDLNWGWSRLFSDRFFWRIHEEDNDDVRRHRPIVVIDDEEDGEFGVVGKTNYKWRKA